MQQEKPQWYTIEEAASILRLHPETMRLMCKQGRIPGARKIGNSWRIPRSSVDAPEPPDDHEQKRK